MTSVQLSARDRSRLRDINKDIYNLVKATADIASSALKVSHPGGEFDKVTIVMSTESGDVTVSEEFKMTDGGTVCIEDPPGECCDHECPC